MNLAYHFNHIHLAHVNESRGMEALSEHEVHIIAIASLMIAIKLKHPQMHQAANEQFLANALICELGDDSTDVSALHRMENDMLASSLEGRLHDVTTMHQFAFLFCKLHPVLDVRPSLLDYLFSVTRYQAESAFLHPTIMRHYKPSVIAFAALVRLLDEDGYEYERLIEDLVPIIESDERHVVSAIFELENNVPNIPRSEEFEAIMAASLAARRHAESIRHIAITHHRPESPSCVGGV